MTNWLEANDSEFVCYCIEVDKKTIVDAINRHCAPKKSILRNKSC